MGCGHRHMLPCHAPPQLWRPGAMRCWATALSCGLTLLVVCTTHPAMATAAYNQRNNMENATMHRICCKQSKACTQACGHAARIVSWYMPIDYSQPRLHMPLSGVLTCPLRHLGRSPQLSSSHQWNIAHSRRQQYTCVNALWLHQCA